MHRVVILQEKFEQEEDRDGETRTNQQRFLTGKVNRRFKRQR